MTPLRRTSSVASTAGGRPARRSARPAMTRSVRTEPISILLSTTRRLTRSADRSRTVPTSVRSVARIRGRDRMGDPWDADIQITEDAAVNLIAEQFPELAPVQAVVLGVGWDNLALLVNVCWVFRFPHRKVAGDLLEREVRTRPLLAPHLPLPIPVPAFAGAPTVDYPYVFAGYALLPGGTACRVSLAEHERAALAPALAGFLAALHGIPITAETRAWAPGDDIARADVRRRAPQLKARLLANAARLPAQDVRALTALVDGLAAHSGRVQQSCWVHGDLYARHLLVDEGAALTGVIDWGDVHVGDRALDLSIAFSFLPPAARYTFRQAYGEIDEATWVRARFRALHYGAILVEYGANSADPAIKALGEYALQYAPAPP